ncbi:hypothetical protein P8605_06390 [Streptomyces sp. T-3]|nr:hypothetical protein [Streptomyces sp. T-3]
MRVARLAVVLALCLTPTLACGEDGDGGNRGSSSGGGVGGGLPAPGGDVGGGGGDVGGGDDGGGGGKPAPGSGGKGGGKENPLKIPEWGATGKTFYEGSPNWDEVVAKFKERCGGELCVTLKRKYDPNAPYSETLCGYSHTEPESETEVKRWSTVYIVGRGPCPPHGSPSPDPDRPDPETTDPVTPDPVTTDPVTPDPVTSDPVTPAPLLTESPAAQ